MSGKRALKNLFDGVETLFDIAGKAPMPKPKYKSQRSERGQFTFKRAVVKSDYTPSQYDLVNLIVDSDNVAGDLNKAINKLNYVQKHKK